MKLATLSAAAVKFRVKFKKVDKLTGNRKQTNRKYILQNPPNRFVFQKYQIAYFDLLHPIRFATNRLFVWFFKVALAVK